MTLPATTALKEAVDRSFVERVGALSPQKAQAHDLPLREGSGLTGARALELFDAQLGSRHLDLAARTLRASGKGFYTIGSSGHEGNAAVADVLRETDPALLHYRSGAFFLARARKVPAVQGVRDVLLGMFAAKAEPMAGGRHKVFGSVPLCILPQTSTIASHLPRSVGLAFAIERSRKLGVPCPYPHDSVVVCSFGDASSNHSTATGAINTAIHCAHQHLPIPLLFVCEDNGIGISVRTPKEWVRAAYGNREGLRYFEADGSDLVESWDIAQEAAAWVRSARKPAFLRLRVVRLMGHAGSDAEASYRSQAEITAEYALDPVLRTAELLVNAGVITPDEALARYEAKRAEVRALADEITHAAQLMSAAEVMAPLAPRRAELVRAEVARAPSAEARQRAHDGKLPEEEGPLTLALSITKTLADMLAKHPELLVFGEDIGRKGGVYGVTKGLARRFGVGRVFDTLLDEQSILGLALGAGLAGFLPIPEIQYLAYLHNAEDQIRGEAATLSFFSNGQHKNPMVARLAGYGYQKGFGGHFHNDNAVGVLRDIPGLVIASPARPDDAAAMLRTCVGAAAIDGSVCIFLEPIALYHTRDQNDDGDGVWLAPYAPPSRWEAQHVPIGRGRTHGDGSDLTIVTWGNGLYMSLRVARRLATEGVSARVLDLRWLAPLPQEDLLREAEATGRVLVVDETRRTGGVAEGVLATLIDAGFTGAMARVASEDSFIPLGDAARLVLLSEKTIEDAARKLARLQPRR